MINIDVDSDGEGFVPFRGVGQRLGGSAGDAMGVGRRLVGGAGDIMGAPFTPPNAQPTDDSQGSTGQLTHAVLYYTPPADDSLELGCDCEMGVDPTPPSAQPTHNTQGSTGSTAEVIVHDVVHYTSPADSVATGGESDHDTDTLATTKTEAVEIMAACRDIESSWLIQLNPRELDESLLASIDEYIFWRTTNMTKDLSTDEDWIEKAEYCKAAFDSLKDGIRDLLESSVPHRGQPLKRTRIRYKSSP